MTPLGVACRGLMLLAMTVLPIAASAQTRTMDITAPGPAGALHGTLLAPSAQGAPVVLIIPGSGPTDRNGNNPLGVHAATYRLLAEGLAAHGIASVRIDKRGMFGSAAATPDANDVTLDDYAHDVLTWVTTLRQRTGASCIWLLGHSEGGLVALAAAQAQTDICGLILVATAGRPVGVVLREQLRANPANAPYLDNAFAVLDALKAGHTVAAANIDPVLLPLFNPQVQRFLMSELTRDPAALIARQTRPVLIVQGLRDLQVGRDDAERLAQANPHASLVLIPDTNHVLKTVRTDDRDENLATYANPALPLADGVIAPIARFIGQATAAR